MVKRGFSASNGFWNTSCAWRPEAAQARRPRGRARAAPSKAIEPAGRLDELQHQAAERGLAAARLAHDGRRHRPRRRRSSTPSSACTAGCSPRTISPSERVTGKCFTTSRSSTSAAMSPGSMRRCGASVGLAVAQAGREMVVCGRCDQRRARRCRRGSANGQRGAKRQPAGGSLQVGRAAAGSAPAPARRTARSGRRCAGPSCRDGAAAPAPRAPGRSRSTWPAYITTTSSQR